MHRSEPVLARQRAAAAVATAAAATAAARWVQEGLRSGVQYGSVCCVRLMSA